MKYKIVVFFLSVLIILCIFTGCSSDQKISETPAEAYFTAFMDSHTRPSGSEDDWGEYIAVDLSKGYTALNKAI